MDLVCLWVGRLVIGALVLYAVPAMYWIAFERLRKLIDPTEAFWDFYLQRCKRKEEGQ